MNVYRETATVTRPPGLVSRALADRLGASDDRGSGTAWNARRLGGLYRYAVSLDRETGTVETTVAVPSGFRVLSAASLLVAVAAVVVDVPPTGYLLALWAALRDAHDPLLADAVAAVLLAVGAGTYYVADSFGTDGRVTALGIPLSGLLPALFAAGNAVIATTLLEGAKHPRLAAALTATVALGFTLVFLVYSAVALRSFETARLAPLRSPASRLAGAVLYLSVTVVLIGATLAALALLAVGVPGAPPAPAPDPGGVIAPAYPTLDAAFAPLPGPARLYSVGLYALVVAPVLLTVAGWGYYVTTGLAARLAVVVRSRPVESPLPGVDVRVVAASTPLVRPVALGLGAWRFVLVSVPVVAALSREELAAVLAHEAYHVAHRDLLVNALATLASVALGGRNALLAFYDYPRREREADARAAEVAGRPALVSALRRLEALGTGDAALTVADGGDPGDPVGTGRGHAPRTGTWKLRWLLGAPYRLFFGRVLLDGAHRSVDDRIAALADGGGGGGGSGDDGGNGR